MTLLSSRNHTRTPSAYIMTALCLNKCLSSLPSLPSDTMLHTTIPTRKQALHSPQLHLSTASLITHLLLLLVLLRSLLPLPLLLLLLRARILSQPCLSRSLCVRV